MRAKKILAILLTALLLFSLAGCGGEAPSSSDVGSQQDVLKIGILQMAQHPALDAAREGFIQGLKDAGYVDGENISIDVQNASNEVANCVTIADKFVNDKVDLILAIATDAAQAAANATQEIPILVTAVTDPAHSEIVASNDAPGGNVSGTSDMNPIKDQVELLTQLVPNVKKVGMLYCSSESNSQLQVKLASEALAEMNVESVDFSVSDLNDIQSVVNSMVGKVDAVYIPTDNMMANGMTTVSQVLNDAKIPAVVGEEAMSEKGGLATYSLNYYDLGVKTAEMAVKIFKGEAQPATMPIEYMPAEECKLFLNKKTAEACGITLPEALLEKAGENVFE